MKRSWLFPLSCSTLFAVCSPLVIAAVETLPASGPASPTFKKDEADSELIEPEPEKIRTTKESSKIDMRVQVETDEGQQFFNIQLNEEDSVGQLSHLIQKCDSQSIGVTVTYSTLNVTCPMDGVDYSASSLHPYFDPGGRPKPFPGSKPDMPPLDFSQQGIAKTFFDGEMFGVVADSLKNILGDSSSGPMSYIVKNFFSVTDGDERVHQVHLEPVQQSTQVQLSPPSDQNVPGAVTLQDKNKDASPPTFNKEALPNREKDTDNTPPPGDDRQDPPDDRDRERDQDRDRDRDREDRDPDQDRDEEADPQPITEEDIQNHLEQLFAFLNDEQLLQLMALDPDPDQTDGNEDVDNPAAQRQNRRRALARYFLRLLRRSNQEAAALSMPEYTLAEVENFLPVLPQVATPPQALVPVPVPVVPAPEDQAGIGQNDEEVVVEGVLQEPTAEDTPVAPVVAEPNTGIGGATPNPPTFVLRHADDEGVEVAGEEVAEHMSNMLAEIRQRLEAMRRAREERAREQTDAEAADVTDAPVDPSTNAAISFLTTLLGFLEPPDQAYLQGLQQDLDQARLDREQEQ